MFQALNIKKLEEAEFKKKKYRKNTRKVIKAKKPITVVNKEQHDEKNKKANKNKHKAQKLPGVQKLPTESDKSNKKERKKVDKNQNKPKTINPFKPKENISNKADLTTSNSMNVDSDDEHDYMAKPRVNIKREGDKKIKVNVKKQKIKEDFIASSSENDDSSDEDYVTESDFDWDNYNKKPIKLDITAREAGRTNAARNHMVYISDDDI